MIGSLFSYKDIEIALWQCHPFDDIIDGPPGMVSVCFESGEFLVSCLDGRILVRQWSAENASWHPAPHFQLTGKPWSQQIETIIERHENRYPDLKISPRIKRMVTP